MTDAELNRLAAEKMGWGQAKLPDGIDSYYSREEQSWTWTVKEWSPTTDLNHAFMLLLRVAKWYLLGRRHILIAPSEDGEFTTKVRHDNTPQGIARAITIAYLRANGVEVPDA